MNPQVQTLRRAGIGFSIVCLGLGGACGVEEQEWSSGLSSATVSSNGGGILPAQAHFGGKSLTDWLGQYWRWMSGEDVDSHVNNLLFLPLPQTEPSDQPLLFTGHLDVSLEPGTAFLVPCVGWMGEGYTADSQVPDDQFIPKATFVGDDRLIDCVVTLDGALLDLSNYYVEAYFDPPIGYPEVSESGADSVIFHQSIGFIRAPLNVGAHTLTVDADFAGLGGPTFANSWDISVSP